MAGKSSRSGNWAPGPPATRYNASGKNREFYTFENAPGLGNYATGEIAKGLKLLASGKEIDYQGATDVTFTDVGEAEGAFIEKGIDGGSFNDVAQR